MKSLHYFYDDYLDVEAAAAEILSRSLQPRGPRLLFDLVAQLALPSGALTLDVGCGEGAYSLELARQFRFKVVGIDPMPRHLAIATSALHTAAQHDVSLPPLVRFAFGKAEALPLPDQRIAFLWCRDVLVHVEPLTQALAEFRRVLQKDGKVLILHSMATVRLHPQEADWLWSTMRVVPANTDPARFERALAAAQLQILECIDVQSEWKEFAEETSGQVSKKLLYAARLQRDPAGYIRQLGQEAYDILLGDCLWAVYQMIGKLSYRIYILGI
jgi:ubiquinone/menaquinone biosynthesis C-methylase UbiE